MSCTRRIPYFLLVIGIYWLWFGIKVFSVADERLGMGFGARPRAPDADAWDSYAAFNVQWSFSGLLLAAIAVWLIREPEVLLGRCKQDRSVFLVIGLFTLLGLFTPLSPAACSVLLSLEIVVASWPDPTELQPNTDRATHKYSLWFRKTSMKICTLHRRIRIGLLFGFLLVRVALAMSVIEPPPRYAFITTAFDLSLVVFLLSWIADERDLRLLMNR